MFKIFLILEHSLSINTFDCADILMRKDGGFAGCREDASTTWRWAGKELALQLDA